MNRFAVTTLALALAAASGSAFADSRYNDNNRYDNSGYGYEDSTRSDVAQVTSVSPILEQSRAQPRQECWNEPAPRYGNNGYDNRGYGNSGYNGNGTRNNNVGGAVLGAIVGGALGNQAGKGDGRKAATIAGAVLGGAIGNGVARNNDRYNDQRYGQQGGTVQRCRTVSDNYQSEPEVVGYDVTYRYAGQTYRTTTPYHPGKTMRVAVSVRPEDNNGVAYR
jgi:uncharacterized protein YcfJ